jgi:hypothetical protein
MTNQPDNYEPSNTELEMVVDEARKAIGKGPAPRSAAKGVSDMAARIGLLNEQKTKLLKQMELHPSDTQLDSTLVAVNSELREAKKRLAEYQTQAKGQN